MNGCLSKAVALFRNSPNMEDDEIYVALIHQSVESRIAARLVEFVPLAYGRVLLANSGVRFSDSFTRRLSNGKVSEPQLLSSEPVWNAAVAYARTEIAMGVSAEDFKLMAYRSAEFQGVNQMLFQGSELKNIACTPPLLPWTKDGPDVESLG